MVSPSGDQRLASADGNPPNAHPVKGERNSRRQLGQPSIKLTYIMVMPEAEHTASLNFRYTRESGIYHYYAFTQSDLD